MASSLLALLDDIATVLDDVAVLTKIASKKTAGVLGDDLALNAQQVAGVRAARELPVVWAVAKGSLLNKALLVPAALLLSLWAPWAIKPLLMLGGLYLCFEGAEKIIHALARSPQDRAHQAALAQALMQPDVDLRTIEREKIKGAIRTDFVLSAEIIVITLGTVADAAWGTRVTVLTLVAALMTVGVYGFVAAIVKLDDLGLWLTHRDAGAARASGRLLVKTAPYLMKSLSVVGTAAMVLVGGGILMHGLPHEWIAMLTAASQSMPGALAQPLTSLLLDAILGLLAGVILWSFIQVIRHLRGRLRH